MKNAVQFRFLCFVLIMFAVFALNGCRDLFHSQPDINEGTLRLQNIDTSGAYDEGRITRVSVYQWGTSDSIISDSNTINPSHHRDFTLSEGEYRIELTSQVFRGGGYFMPKDRTSNKIIITKGITTVVYYDPSDGTFVY